MRQVGSTGTDTFTALATDAQGNIYLTGATASPNFPVKSATQPTLASIGLYRITGSNYASLGQNNVTSIAIDPQNSNVIYAASSGNLLKSSDAGNTWNPLPIPSSAVTAIAIDPFNDQNLYAAAGTALYNSTNAGANWTALNTGFNSSCGTNGIGIWADSNFEGVPFAVSCGLYRSADAGASWQSVLPLTVGMNVDLEPGMPGVIFVITQGTYESTDDGQTFQKIPAPNGTSSVVIDPNQPNRLLAAAASGIYASTDTGATWTLVSSLSPYLLIPANGFVYADLYNGLAQLSPNLQSATPVGPPGLPTITASAYTNGNLYVGVAHPPAPASSPSFPAIFRRSFFRPTSATRSISMPQAWRSAQMTRRSSAAQRPNPSMSTSTR